VVDVWRPEHSAAVPWRYFAQHRAGDHCVTMIIEIDGQMREIEINAKDGRSLSRFLLSHYDKIEKRVRHPHVGQSAGFCQACIAIHRKSVYPNG
jgi:hypothetical protein